METTMEILALFGLTIPSIALIYFVHKSEKNAIK